MPNSLPLLVQSSLGIHSTLKRQSLKHNVVDREKIVIPPNWDSWGKIRVLRNGFDVEAVSKGWSLEIQPPEQISTLQAGDSASMKPELRGPLIEYEETIQDPGASKARTELEYAPNGLEVESVAMQDFLAEQVETMERLKVEEDQRCKLSGKDESPDVHDAPAARTFIEDTSRVKEHVGPIQFNMGGIQLDAEDMLSKIKERTSREDKTHSAERDVEPPSSPNTDGQEKPKQEALASFFAGLIKKSGGGSAPGTPPSKGKAKSGQ